MAKGGLLSGSTNGRRILVTGTATGSSVTVHTANASATIFDRIWIDAYNHHTAPVLLTLEWGGTTSPNDLITLTIPNASGLFVVESGGRLRNGLVVKAFAATANVITLGGGIIEPESSEIV